MAEPELIEEQLPSEEVVVGNDTIQSSALTVWHDPTDGQLYITVAAIASVLTDIISVGSTNPIVSVGRQVHRYVGGVEHVPHPTTDLRYYLLPAAVASMLTTWKTLKAANPNHAGVLALTRAASDGALIIAARNGAKEAKAEEQKAKGDEAQRALELDARIAELQQRRLGFPDGPSAVLDGFLKVAAKTPALQSLMLAHFEKLPVAAPQTEHMMNAHKMKSISRLDSGAGGNFPYLGVPFAARKKLLGKTFLERHARWEGFFASKHDLKKGTIKKITSFLTTLEYFAEAVRLHTEAGGLAPGGGSEGGLLLGSFDTPLDFIRCSHTLYPAFFCHRYTYKSPQWLNTMSEFTTLSRHVITYIREDAPWDDSQPGLSSEMDCWGAAHNKLGAVMKTQTAKAERKRVLRDEQPIDYLNHMQKCARIGMVYTVLSCLPDGLVSSEDKADLLKARDYIAGLTVYGTHQHVFAGPFRPGNIATAHRHDWNPTGERAGRPCMDERCTAMHKDVSSHLTVLCHGNRPYLVGDDKCAVPYFQEQHFKTENSPVHSGHFIYPYQEKGVALQAMLLYSVDVRHRLAAKPEADHLLLLSPTGLAAVGSGEAGMYARLSRVLADPYMKHNASSLRAGCIGPGFQTYLDNMVKAKGDDAELAEVWAKINPLESKMMTVFASAGKTSGRHLGKNGAYDRTSFLENGRNYNAVMETYQGLHYTRRWSVSRAIHLLNGRTVVAPDGDAAELGDVLAPHLTDDPLPYELKICLDHYGIGLDAVGLEPEHFEAKPEEDAELAWHIEKLPGGARLPLAREPEEPAADRKRKAPASEEDSSEASAQTA